MHIKPRFPLAPTLMAVLLMVVIAHAQQPDTASSKLKSAGNIEVLSDTKGVDFRPYLSELLKTVRTNWYNLIPEEARPPQLLPGITTIEFAVLPNGTLAGVRIVHPSGSVPLDRAAWGRSHKRQPLRPFTKAVHRTIFGTSF